MKVLFLISSLFVLTGCSTSYLAQRGPYLRSYHEGAFCQAEEKINALAVETKAETNLQKCKEASWILLDRALIRFAMGKIDEALSDFDKALESLDYYNKTLLTEKCTQILFQDEASAYQADDFEQILARVYFALALLQNGDDQNAFALLRQADEFIEEKRIFYSKIPFTKHYRIVDNGLSKYLFALLLEKKGDISNANIVYNQALSILPNICQLPRRTCSKQATVLILCHNGNAPYKISTTCPASVASAIALECVLASQEIDPAWSTLTGIPIPALCAWPGSYPIPTSVQIDSCHSPLFPLFNVTAAAQEQLEQKIPEIAAQGVARILLRRGTVEYFNRVDPCLGMIADVTMLLVNAETRADTRSWTTLPSLIEGTRFNLEPGEHIFTVSDSFNSCPRAYYLNLKANDLCIINIFNIHPDVSQILIPSHFLKNQGVSPCIQ